AILETVIAVPLYWWIALHTGVVLPLLVSVAVAPMVLLRSDQSVELGLKWFRRVEKVITKLLNIFDKVDPKDFSTVFNFIQTIAINMPKLIFLIIFIPIIAFVSSVVIRISATFFNLRDGVEALPRNFRRITLCWSPSQMPELVPGLVTIN